mmetsp:Transcript_21826/g.56923  ORF Transcript_21826/g.56923 Transcript_21826/m.56923 type:complete len:251 (-) Transcript_21826:453-1205(-)
MNLYSADVNDVWIDVRILPFRPYCGEDGQRQQPKPEDGKRDRCKRKVDVGKEVPSTIFRKDVVKALGHVQKGVERRVAHHDNDSNTEGSECVRPADERRRDHMVCHHLPKVFLALLSQHRQQLRHVEPKLHSVERPELTRAVHRGHSCNRSGDIRHGAVGWVEPIPRHRPRLGAANPPRDKQVHRVEDGLGERRSETLVPDVVLALQVRHIVPLGSGRSNLVLQLRPHPRHAGSSVAGSFQRRRPQRSQH